MQCLIVALAKFASTFHSFLESLVCGETFLKLMNALLPQFVTNGSIAGPMVIFLRLL
jgi:hypothetical protein